VEATLRHQAKRARVLHHDDHLDDVLRALANKMGVQLQATDALTLQSMADGLPTQGLVLACDEFLTVDIEDFAKAPPLTVVLDGIEDPRNFGAAARAAYALGANLLVVPFDRAAAPTASAVRASAGALCRIPLVRATNLRRALELLKQKGAWIVGAEADGEQALWDVDLTGSTVLVIGGEDRGLRRLTRESCDHVVHVPMTAQDMSLNAADAATLLLYEALRQRRKKG
jgi:23S rRNA (guanosine2251-2'-O)-methyltransferase